LDDPNLTDILDDPNLTEISHDPNLTDISHDPNLTKPQQKLKSRTVWQFFACKRSTQTDTKCAQAVQTELQVVH
jgi:hypothetical protein